MTRIQALLAIAVVCAAAACSSPPASSNDAGTTDSGMTTTQDAGSQMGSSDAGGHDAGISDGGSEMGMGDAGTADAGTAEDGGASSDGGSVVDAGGTDHAGSVVDAGTSDDAGTGEDAGAADGGSSMDAGDNTAGVTQTTATLNQINAAMSTFHSDTGGWPIGNGVWYGASQPWNANSEASIEAMPGQFTQHDTALFSRAADPNTQQPLVACSGSPHTQPCWNGPYLMGTAQSMADVKDAWGHTLLFAYYGSFDNGTGTSPLAPNGAIIIWSAGPNGLDDTGCYTTEVGTPMNCLYDEDSVAQGTAGGDDILMVVSSDVTSFN